MQNLEGSAQTKDRFQNRPIKGLEEREKVTYSKGRGGIFGIKAGMTQVYTPEGDVVAVTVIALKPNLITQIKKSEKEGYSAIQVGFLEKEERKLKKAECGHLHKVQAPALAQFRELRLSDAELAGLEAGKLIDPLFLKAGDYVDLTAINKGKGFQGGMKRYHMAGGPKSHGASVCHRSLGSIGNRADPGKCFKNKKMAGQMGNVRVTLQNLKVVRVDLENQLLLVHGSVPGPKSGVIQIRKTVKGASR